MPSSESNSTMPAANSNGKHSWRCHGRTLEVVDALNARNAISVAVSNPNPKSRPTKYMCHGALTHLETGRSTQLKSPPLRGESSVDNATCSAVRLRRKIFQKLRNARALDVAIRYKNPLEIFVPTLPAIAVNIEPG